MNSNADAVGTAKVLARYLVAGDVVAFDEALWLVVRVEPLDDVRWSWRVLLRPIGESLDWTACDGDRSIRCGAVALWARYDSEHGEHRPVCGRCGGPWPCRELHIDEQVRAEVARAERYALPGVCPACQEPVTLRQLRQVWPMNLYGPDSGQVVTFHLRRQCEAEAVRYDRAMIAAGYQSRLGITLR